MPRCRNRRACSGPAANSARANRARWPPAAAGAAAAEIYNAGRASADLATQLWRNRAEFQGLLGAAAIVTVGLPVEPAACAKIREANGSPRLAQVPPDQDAQEFEL